MPADSETSSVVGSGGVVCMGIEGVAPGLDGVNWFGWVPVVSGLLV